MKQKRKKEIRIFFMAFIATLMMCAIDVRIAVVAAVITTYLTAVFVIILGLMVIQDWLRKRKNEKIDKICREVP